MGVSEQAGIMYLHSKKSMHCDIKEANVMISGDTDWHNPILGLGAPSFRCPQKPLSYY